MLSVSFFAKTWWRETIKKTVAKRYQFMENFRLLFGLLTPCYVAEEVPRTDLRRLATVFLALECIL